MTRTIIYVTGTPRPQPRARHTPSGAVVSTTGKLPKKWKEAIARECARSIASDGVPDFGGAFAVDHVFWFGTAKPERWGLPHTAKPDRDNLDKLVLDTLRQSGLFRHDDSYVADGRITKLWSPRPALMSVLRPWGTEPMTLAEIIGSDDDDVGVIDFGDG